MPHASFGTTRLGDEREPITFDFGLYGEETFTVIPEPTLGDTYDLYDAPEPTPTNHLESSRVLARFIRRLLAPDDKKRFDLALYRIPATQAHLIIETATWITEQLTTFPTQPPASYSGGRKPSRPKSSQKSGGTSSSKTSKPKSVIA